MADPQVDEGSIPITDLDELETHLQELLQSPDTVLDEDIIDNVGLQLTGMSSLCWLDVRYACFDLRFVWFGCSISIYYLDLSLQ